MRVFEVGYLKMKHNSIKFIFFYLGQEKLLKDVNGYHFLLVETKSEF